MKKNMSAGKVFGSVFYALVLIMMAFIILAILFGNKGKNGISLGPFNMFTVLSGSMSPSFEAGSVIITKKTDAHKLQAGDILTYAPLNDNTLVTHRIVEVIHDSNGYSYITKGDANNVNDLSPVFYEDTVGRVIYWKNGLGNALLLIRTPWGIAFIATVILLPSVIYFLFGKFKV